MNRPPTIAEAMEGDYIVHKYGATVADYERIATEDSRLELLDGVLIMHSPANVGHERLFWFLGDLIRGYAAPRKLGEVFGSRTPMVLEDERRFEPDLLFIKNENLQRLGEIALEGPADLVIEILSPATRDYDLSDKRDAYGDAGVPEYWIVDPLNERFMVDRPAGDRVTDMAFGRYDCAAIKGFWLDVGWLWQRPLPDVRDCLAQIEAK